jgi:hypothetical protein
MSKKNRNLSAAAVSSLSSADTATAVLDVPASDTSLPEATSDTSLPETAPIASELGDSFVESLSRPIPPVQVVGATPAVRDLLGYGTGTETSFILSGILAGTYTRPALLSAFLAKFAGSDAEEIKRKKTTFSVFFSDVKRPIGTYHASRGLVLTVSEDTGIVSVTPESFATAKRVVDAGILTALRGITRKGKPKAYAKVLESFGLPVPSDKD